MSMTQLNDFIMLVIYVKKTWNFSNKLVNFVEIKLRKISLTWHTRVIWFIDVLIVNTDM